MSALAVRRMNKRRDAMQVTSLAPSFGEQTFCGSDQSETGGATNGSPPDTETQWLSLFEDGEKDNW
jgi:hypothetical protein